MAPPPAKAAPASAAPAPPVKAPTKILVREKKTGKLTGQVQDLVKRDKRRLLGKNLDIDQRKVQVDIYQKMRADRSDPANTTRRLVHVKTVRWSFREYRARFDIPV